MKESLDHDGYVVLPDILSPPELERLRDETTEQLRAVKDGTARPLVREKDGIPFRVENIAAFPIRDRCVLAARVTPTLLDAMSELIADDVVSYGAVMVFKLPAIGPAVDMHRDIAEGVFSDNHLWLAAGCYLDDSTVENGCLWAIPGSHKLRGPALASAAAEGLDSADAVPIPVPAGGVLLHDARLLHGSKPATAGGLRRVLYHSYQSASQMLAEGLKRSFRPDRQWIAESFTLMRWGLELRAAYGYLDPPVRWQVPAPWAGECDAIDPADELAVIRYRVTDSR